ncbi:hypothetical protein [Mycolicibacter sinensis]|uniref:hypothetical protein n=1 Tax=Mycolicibacter sinensis (strain JDM601) TaxID=875328 RepID=UPI0009EF3D7F|nr:hypothetical protein [Mycolicibacter sinensis]
MSQPTPDPSPTSNDPVHSTPEFVASVKPFDTVASGDAHPLARVRYGRGTAFVRWRHIRHDTLLAETGRTLDYWLRIDAYASQIIYQVRELISKARIPAVADFADLHNHLDANTGWGNPIDSLSAEDFAAVQWRFTDRIRTEEPLT